MSVLLKPRFSCYLCWSRNMSKRRRENFTFDKTREPYNIRFPISPLDIEDPKKVPGGNKQMADLIARTHALAPQEPGGYDKSGKFHHIEELEPEFVVPDLSGFKLKAYVPYNAPELHQEELLPKDLFNMRYGQRIAEDVKNGRISSSEDIETYMDNLASEMKSKKNTAQKK